jgi:putative ABC transport system ATP-binding protein
VSSSASGAPAAEAGRADDASSLLRCDHLNKVYPDGNVAAVVDVNLEVRKGEYVAIMGPSGCGKTSLLNLIGALDVPTSGEISFEGQPFSRIKDLDGLRSAKIGFVFQAFYLLPTLTAIENVQVPMFEGSLTARQREQRAKELLESTGVGHRLRHLPSQLSAGERQRVAIARALANEPVLLLADEPTGNLDSHTGEEILAQFRDLHGRRKMTLIVVTHSQDVAEQAQRLIRMRDGRIIEDAPTRRGRGS